VALLAVTLILVHPLDIPINRAS